MLSYEYIIIPIQIGVAQECNGANQTTDLISRYFREYWSYLLILSFPSSILYVRRLIKVCRSLDLLPVLDPNNILCISDLARVHSILEQLMWKEWSVFHYISDRLVSSLYGFHDNLHGFTLVWLPVARIFSKSLAIKSLAKMFIQLWISVGGSMFDRVEWSIFRRIWKSLLIP